MIQAVAFFCVSERLVDRQMEAAHDEGNAPARWIVFGTDLHLLGALERHWRTPVDLVVAFVPASSAAVRDSALLVLDREGIAVGETVWVHGDALACEPPSGVHSVVRVGSVVQMQRELIDLLGEHVK